MTLDEAFKKYPDTTVMKRKNSLTYQPFNIKWLKQLKAYGNEESRKLGFFIPDGMISDADADDWEVVE